MQTLYTLMSELGARGLSRVTSMWRCLHRSGATRACRHTPSPDHALYLRTSFLVNHDQPSSGGSQSEIAVVSDVTVTMLRIIFSFARRIVQAGWRMVRDGWTLFTKPCAVSSDADFTKTSILPDPINGLNEMPTGTSALE
jgi:hypothetical protein